MISSFEVGAVFKIVNEASPALTKILEQIRAISKALAKAKQSMEAFGTIKMPTGMTLATSEAEALATAWGNVAKNAVASRKAINAANGAGAKGGAAAAVGGGGGAKGGGGVGHGGGGYFGRTSVPIAG